LSISLPKNQ
jgi:hypothetical protein